MQAKGAFTLVEVLLVVVVLSILAAAVSVYYVDVVSDTKVDIARHSVSQMRAHLERYKGTHGGLLPGPDLRELAKQTNVLGQIGTGAEFRYGPYVTEIPTNPLTDSSRVVAITNSPPLASDVDPNGGWLYNPTTGELWISHPDHFLE